MSKLLPCPFCGGKPHGAEPEVNINYVGCTECLACAPNEAVWNTRPTPAPCDELETVAYQYEWPSKKGEWRTHAPLFVDDYGIREIVTRQNAEEVIAAKDARIAELEAERYKLALAITGGEDAPGYLDSLTVETLVDVALDNTRRWFTETDRAETLEADNKRLRDALENLVERFTYYADLARDGVPNIEDWAYSEGSSDIAKARAALAEVKL